MEEDKPIIITPKRVSSKISGNTLVLVYDNPLKIHHIILFFCIVPFVVLGFYLLIFFMGIEDTRALNYQKKLDYEMSVIQQRHDMNFRFEHMGEELKPLSEEELWERTREWRNNHRYLLEYDRSDYLIGVWLPIGLFLFCFIFYYFVYRRFAGNDRIVVDRRKEEIVVSKNALSKLKKISTKDIVQFFCIASQYSSNQSTSEYELRYVDRHNTQHFLLALASDPQVGVYIESQIEKFLEIKDVKVKGSVS